MIKKIVPVLVFLAAVVSGCVGEKYADVKAHMNHMITLQNEMLAALEKAKDSTDPNVVSGAMDTNKEKILKLFEKGGEYNKKYPELKDKKNPPPELKVEYEKMEEIEVKMAALVSEIVKNNMKNQAVLNVLQE
ncbi:MAG: hypothetical protein GY754_19940 [bacterium]|nr:hypothetical protein [bacterium]